MKVHFICRGNVLRSLIAETYLRSLQLEGVEVMSSGTNVDLSDANERQYFANTMAILKRHGIDQFAKPLPEQLTQQRADGQDITVCMNQRVVDEASRLVTLRAGTICWNIVDIGEGDRMNTKHRELYEEDIYQEIVTRVDRLI
jgi:protein-tyrosine-phosphatase